MDPLRQKYGWVMPNEETDRGNIGSGNGLFPDATKPLLEHIMYDS